MDRDENSVEVELVIELGRTRLSVDTLLHMEEGTLIELDKVSGEPVDVRMNGTRIGGGEVVVVEENFGVRVIEWEEGRE
jgi:flagellar motor switch protein FliN